MADPLSNDVAAIASIDAIPSILKIACSATGLRFAAVARVTETRWTACAVRDDIAFGLTPGDELDLASTICNEIRDTGETVTIDEVSTDARFQDHHTPRQYGFQSYISATPSRPLTPALPYLSKPRMMNGRRAFFDKCNEAAGGSPA